VWHELGIQQSIASGVLRHPHADRRDMHRPQRLEQTPATVDASGANAAQFSVWPVLTNVAKAQDGSAAGPTPARAARSAMTAASCASVEGGNGMPDSMRPSAASRCLLRACATGAGTLIHDLDMPKCAVDDRCHNW